VKHEYEIHTDEMCPYIAKRKGDSGLRIVTGLNNNIPETGQWPSITVMTLNKPKVPFGST